MAKILVVEDDAATLLLIEEWLRRDGHDVLISADGNEAETMFRQELPDLLVCDVHIPGQSGTELSRKLLDDYGDLRLILIAGNETTDTFGLKMVARFGGFSHLMKPLDQDQFLRAVSDVLG